jgi:HAD superfamily hydrolase (TIGR01549 family)
LSIRAVFFDIGETLINETRQWSLVADTLEVPRFAMFAILGSLIAEGRDHRDLFDIVTPEQGWQGVVAKLENNDGFKFQYDDLYADAVPCLDALKRRGYFVGIAGNQPASREQELRQMNLPVDLIATSAGWGLKKPDRAFFQRIVTEAGCRAQEVVYVGDRVDNDVVPAAQQGLRPVHIVRGPWGYVQREWTGIALAKAQVKSLEGLPEMVGRW